jgi:hypothetical protein
MKKSLFILSLGLIMLAACQAQLKPVDVVLGAVKGWDAGDIDASKIDASLAYYADDAVINLVGLPPGQPDTFSSKGQIRSWWEELTAQHFNMTVEILSTEGDTVTTKTLTWMDWSRKVGIAPLEATEEYVIKDGKIVSQTWTITEASKAKLMAALAPTPVPLPTELPTATLKPTNTPIQETPTPTALPEVPVSQIEDILGIWNGYWSDTASLYTELTSNGEYRLFFRTAGEPGKGTFSLDGNLLTWETAEGDSCAQNPIATYEVFVTKRVDQPVNLRFVLVGEDLCWERKEYLDGKVLTFVEY